MSVILGFTGTIKGMTDWQKHRFTALIQDLMPTEFHHGDCFGSDTEAHEIVRFWSPGTNILIHPPIIKDYASNLKGDIIYRAKPYLERNKDIVASCDVLVATPKEPDEQRRSGTWYTVRRARDTGKRIILLLPERTLPPPTLRHR